jgi:hypothetical protein
MRPRGRGEPLFQQGAAIALLRNESGYKQTVSGRRKRLRVALDALLREKGWQAVRQDVYSRAASGTMQE